MNFAGFQLANAMAFAAAHGLHAEADEIQSMPVHPDITKPHMVRKACFVELFESRGLIDEFVAQSWPGRHTDHGARRRQIFMDAKLRNEHLLSGTSDVSSADEEEEEVREQGFALEAELRDFLAANLHIVESGLKLYRDGDEDGIEFPIDGGRIDILAVDKQGTPVVLELKLSQGRSKTIGQLLYYMGWVDKNLEAGPSRGIIIARGIPNDLVVATSRVPGVSLYRYRISMSLERVSPSTDGRASTQGGTTC